MRCSDHVYIDLFACLSFRNNILRSHVFIEIIIIIITFLLYNHGNNDSHYKVVAYMQPQPQSEFVKL